jgi:hypothetical protein
MKAKGLPVSPMPMARRPGEQPDIAINALPIPGIRKSDRAVDGQPPGFQIQI